MRVVSLFAGCGGLDLGLIRAGHKIVMATDFDKDCKKTYDANFDHSLFLKDVNTLTGDELPEYDLLCGGFPCQGFSMSGKRDMNDPRNKLYLEVVDIVKTLNPEFMLNIPSSNCCNKIKRSLISVENF
jgi:DNA (cytosine-5)-methyltransferase 1